MTSGIQKGDALLQEELRKERGERNYTGAKAQFQSLENSEDRTEVAQAKGRLKKISNYEEDDRLIQGSLDRHDATEKEIAKIEQGARQMGPVKPAVDDPFVARGWVTELNRFTGRQATHRLMKGNQVLYYLKSEEGNPVSLDACLHKRVGLKGKILELDPNFGAKLILVKEIVVLSDY
jgi:hypothetical protein